MSAGSAEWLPVLRDFARLSGHELRNALNGLVVNLEVVRARTSGEAGSAEPFLGQAIEQAEQSVRLAEGTIALLNMVVAAIDGTGSVRARFVAPRGVEIEGGESEALRLVKNLSALSSRTSAGADLSGGAVILSIPEENMGSNTSA